MLGKGAYAPVKMAVHKLTGERVAVKNFKRSELPTEVEQRAVEREISTLKMMRHPHIVRLYEVISSKNNLYVVLELAPRGDLDALIAQKGRLEGADAARYTAQVAAALEHCHEHGVIHRDVKPPNILLDAHLNAKLTDFGLSAAGVQPGQLLKHPCGTPAYAAPEVINRFEYDGRKSDVWSLGVMLYVMLHGKLPFLDHTQVRAGAYKYDPDRTPPAALDVLRAMLSMDVERRISVAQLLSTPWLTPYVARVRAASRHRYGVTYFEPDASLLSMIEKDFGFRASHVADSLRSDAFNHATATYALLEEAAERTRSGDQVAMDAP